MNQVIANTPITENRASLACARTRRDNSIRSRIERPTETRVGARLPPDFHCAANACTYRRTSDNGNERSTARNTGSGASPSRRRPSAASNTRCIKPLVCATETVSASIIEAPERSAEICRSSASASSVRTRSRRRSDIADRAIQVRTATTPATAADSEKATPSTGARHRTPKSRQRQPRPGPQQRSGEGRGDRPPTRSRQHRRTARRRAESTAREATSPPPPNRDRCKDTEHGNDAEDHRCPDHELPPSPASP